MKTESRIARLTGKTSLGVVLVLCLLFMNKPAQAADDYWVGKPNSTATTNWSDINNWSSAQQTYYNEVEFLGTGTNANSNFAVNNVLDVTTGVAQMPIWELDYWNTNGNYTTLINPGVNMNLGAGNGKLEVGAGLASDGSTASTAPSNAVETITIEGAGAYLSMDGTLYVAQGSPAPKDTHMVTLVLSNLDNFVDNGGAGSGTEILVAAGGAAHTHGTLYLAKTNQITLGNDFQICNQTTSNSQPCAVYLGQVNSILTGTGNLIVGGTGTTTNGASLQFNPSFLGGANPPTASFGGNGVSGLMANFYISDANGAPQIAGNALCNFTGGNVTMLVANMELGQGGNAGANANGTLTFNDGVITANNVTNGNQEVSNGGTGIGIINLNSGLGTNATLQVNNTLTLAAVTGTLKAGSAGTININGGQLIANTIVNGAGTGTITMTNGTLTVTGVAGASNAAITSLFITNSFLNLPFLSGTNSVVTTNLNTGGTSNIINVISTPPFASFPAITTLIKYTGSIGGAGYNFVLGTLPPLCQGYLSNVTASTSIELVLTNGPTTLTWVGNVSDNWDTTTTNWGSYTYASGDFVNFLDGADTGTVDLTTALLPGGVTVSNNVLSYTFNGPGSLGGSGSLLKEGTGTLLIDNSSANTFSGGVTVKSGTLQVGNNDTAGSLPSGSLVNNGNLVYAGSGNVTVGNDISGTGSFTQAGAGGSLLLSGNNTFSGNVTVTNGSTLQLGNSTVLGVGTNTVTVASGSTLDADGNTTPSTIIVSGTGVGGNGAIIDSGGAIYDDPGPGLATNIILAGNTTFGFPTRWDLGSTTVGSVLTANGAYNLTLNSPSDGYFEWNNLSVLSPLANITIADGQLGAVGSTTFGNPNSTLILSPSGELVLWGANVHVNKQVDFQNGATINNASGANTMNGGMLLEAGDDTFIVNGGTTLSLSNVLSGSGVFYLNGGSGTTVLFGNSPSFTGGVSLYTGQLTLNGFIGSGITSQSGTTISGMGTANGLVDVSGTLWPGDGGVATFTNGTGGLTLESPATLTVDMNSTSNDLIVVNGNLTVNGNNITIDLLGAPAAGTYTIMTYTGSLIGSFGTVSTASSSRYSFTLNTNTPNKINLVVAGQPNLLEWNNNANNGNWDVQTSYNWSNLTSHVEDEFYSADYVLFDDTILNDPHPSTTININGGVVVTPTAITNNSTASYTISGSGDISGDASVVKLGIGTLNINTTNDFTGNITVGGGALQVNGILQPGASPVGATNGTLYVTNGATLIVNLGGSYPSGDIGFGYKPLVVSGAGSGSNGAIQNIGNNIYNDSSTIGGLGQIVTLAGNATIGGTARWDWGYPGVLTTLSTLGSNFNFIAIEPGYSQWSDLTIDTNMGNFDFYTIPTNQQTWLVSALGGSLGNPTNVLTLHSNVLMEIVHGDIPADDSGYAKVIHVLPTATFEFTPSGGDGDYRLNTSFVLETNSTLGLYNGEGGSGSGTVVNGTVTLNSLVDISIGNSPVTFSNVISGTGGFFLTNYDHTLVFAATNTYQGATEIGAGMMLALVGNGSISDSTHISLGSGATLTVTNRTDGTLTLASGQTLQGSAGGASVNGILVAGSGSTVAPSTHGDTGTLTVSSNATLNGNILLQLDTASNDVLSVGGTLNYGGTLTLTNISATPLAAGNSFILFSAASYSGAFASISPAAPGAGLAWNTSSLVTNGTLSVVTSSSTPHLTSIAVSGTTLTIMATNGPANGTFTLLESTNVALPLGQWTRILTNSFNASGNLNLSTNIVSPGNPNEFYIIEVP
jgi:fibronectin-binding autotransporter adhesin